ncbi:MAG: hypothetical protein DSZ08_06880 [Sulfurovum sp.]|nr:MAG: hypothetical protein DSZ08_06880 [Sulfurovum sp.]
MQQLLKWTLDTIREEESCFSWMEEYRYEWTPLVKSAISQVMEGKTVLIIAELSIPQCTKYRVEQKVEMLKILGYNTWVVSWTDFHEARQLLQLSALVFFYRTPAYPLVDALIKSHS